MSACLAGPLTSLPLPLSPPRRWRRSSHSVGANNCVECARNDAGALAVRDSKNAARPHLAFSAGAWTSFVRALDGRAPAA
ncbi:MULTISPECIES: DUF397 domain-containing protein [unclassified Streptomyces]|uniref:DUF397 domain-containing protein n=1 Tax=unclassified Streptomyces TaxID=2593676 RepID=UPI0038113D88